MHNSGQKWHFLIKYRVNSILDGTSTIKKEPEDRKSTTPVKNDQNSGGTTDKKETMDTVIKSEGI